MARHHHTHHASPSPHTSRPSPAPARGPVPTPTPTPVQRRLDWLWQQRLHLQLRLHELEATMNSIALEIQTIQRRQQWLALQRPQVMVSILLHRHGSLPQEHAYQQECTWLRNQEWSARSRWAAHSAQWTALQQSLAHLDAEELALRGFPHPSHLPFHPATF